MRAPVADPAPARWKQVLAHRKGVTLEAVDLFKGFWVAEEREDGIVRLRVTDFATAARHDIGMPEAVYSTGAGINAEWDAARFRFVYESYVTPRSVYDYDPASRERTLLKRQPVLGPFDPLDYDSAMLFATAKDGTKVPVSLVWKKALRGENQRSATEFKDAA